MDVLAYVALVVLTSETWALATGKNVNASALADRVTVKKSVSFKQKEDVNLSCGSSTWTSNNIFYIIWTLNLKDKTCVIRDDKMGNNMNNCSDPKSLRNTSEGKPVLHIPHFDYADVGNYSCECSHTGAGDSFLYLVHITAPPVLSSWIEETGDRREVVCLAERGSPGAKITWTGTDNVTEETVWESEGLVSVRSSVDVSAHEDPHNITCVVTHPYWNGTQTVTPEVQTSRTPGPNHLVLSISIGVSVVFCLALLSWGILKLLKLRKRQESSSKVSSEHYVEEVEPYESYVQRVNSIYNSSRDLFA